MRIHLVRHGETEANRLRVMQGHSEEPLNDLGVRQCAALGRRLAGVRVDRIVSSDVRRAAMTAAIVSAFTRAPIQYDPALRERDPGELVHRPYAESVPFFLDDKFEPRGGESVPVFVDRVRRAFSGLVRAEREISGGEGHVAVVTHGMVCGAFIRHVAGHPAAGGAELRWRNTSVTTADYDAEADRWTILSLSDATHLAELDLESEVLDPTADALRLASATGG